MACAKETINTPQGGPQTSQTPAQKSNRRTKAKDKVAGASDHPDTNMNVPAAENIQEHIDAALAAQKGSNHVLIPVVNQKITDRT